MTHPARVGTWAFTLKGRTDSVEDVGHTAQEAFERARGALAKLLERDPSWNDLEAPELIADDCLVPIVHAVAQAWDLPPAGLLESGPKTRQRVEARAACLLIARERFGNDPHLLSKATGWPIALVRDVLKYADGRGGRKVRERVAQLGAAA